MLSHVHFSSPGQDTLTDLGSGDGLVLFQALDTFPKSDLRWAIGVDLDQTLLEQAATKVMPTPHMDRLEEYYGDFTQLSNPLHQILAPTVATGEAAPPVAANVGQVVARSSHLFVYLLPEALSKLVPILLEAVEQQAKIVMSMRWEIPELEKYLVHGGVSHNFYIYQRI
ncbi:hypothetical protein BGZ94_003449 [Podila epigama]|nr:hypothetical protein BGZ94_003449 [Podila epigama]